MLQALEESKTRDRLYIPSRYQLFTLNQVRQVCKTDDESHTAVPSWDSPHRRQAIHGIG